MTGSGSPSPKDAGPPPSQSLPPTPSRAQILAARAAQPLFRRQTSRERLLSGLLTAEEKIQRTKLASQETELIDLSKHQQKIHRYLEYEARKYNQRAKAAAGDSSVVVEAQVPEIETIRTENAGLVLDIVDLLQNLGKEADERRIQSVLDAKSSVNEPKPHGHESGRGGGGVSSSQAAQPSTPPAGSAVHEQKSAILARLQNRRDEGNRPLADTNPKNILASTKMKPPILPRWSGLSEGETKGASSSLGYGTLTSQDVPTSLGFAPKEQQELPPGLYTQSITNGSILSRTSTRSRSTSTSSNDSTRSVVGRGNRESDPLSLNDSGVGSSIAPSSGSIRSYLTQGSANSSREYQELVTGYDGHGRRGSIPKSFLSEGTTECGDAFSLSSDQTFAESAPTLFRKTSNPANDLRVLPRVRLKLDDYHESLRECSQPRSMLDRRYSGSSDTGSTRTIKGLQGSRGSLESSASPLIGPRPHPPPFERTATPTRRAIPSTPLKSSGVSLTQAADALSLSPRKKKSYIPYSPSRRSVDSTFSLSGLGHRRADSNPACFPVPPEVDLYSASAESQADQDFEPLTSAVYVPETPIPKGRLHRHISASDLMADFDLASAPNTYLTPPAQPCFQNLRNLNLSIPRRVANRFAAPNPDSPSSVYDDDGNEDSTKSASGFPIGRGSGRGPNPFATGSPLARRGTAARQPLFGTVQYHKERDQEALSEDSFYDLYTSGIDSSDETQYEILNIDGRPTKVPARAGSTTPAPPRTSSQAGTLSKKSLKLLGVTASEAVAPSSVYSGPDADDIFTDATSTVAGPDPVFNSGNLGRRDLKDDAKALARHYRNAISMRRRSKRRSGGTGSGAEDQDQGTGLDEEKRDLKLMLGKKAEAGKIKIKVKEVKKVKASIKKDVLQVQLFSFQ